MPKNTGIYQHKEYIERLQAAQRIEANALEMINSFQTDKKLEKPNDLIVFEFENKSVIYDDSSEMENL